MEVFIPHKFPTLNEYIQVERSNKFSGASMKKKFTNLAIPYFTQEITVPCEVECVWNFERLNSDGDNIAFGLKFILDGAVKSGKLKSDSLKYVQGFKHDYKKTKEKGVLLKFRSI